MPISINKFELQTIIVQRPSHTKDSSGGAVKTWTTVGGPYPCNIQGKGGRSAHFFGQFQTLSTHSIYFDVDPGVTRADRLKDQDNNYYLVDNVANVAGRSQLWEVNATIQTTAATPP